MRMVKRYFPGAFNLYARAGTTAPTGSETVVELGDSGGLVWSVSVEDAEGAETRVIQPRRLVVSVDGWSAAFTLAAALRWLGKSLFQQAHTNEQLGAVELLRERARVAEESLAKSRAEVVRLQAQVAKLSAPPERPRLVPAPPAPLRRNHH